MNCKNHQDKKAAYHCTKCNNNFCESCTLVRKFSVEFTAYICKECEGRCEALVDSATAGKQPKASLFSPKPKEIKTSEPRITSEKVIKEIPKREVSPPSAAPAVSHFWLSLPGVLFFPLKGLGIFIMFLVAVIWYGLTELNRLSAMMGLAATLIFGTFFGVYIFKTIEDAFHGAKRLEQLPDFDYWNNMAAPIALLGGAALLWLAPAQAYFVYFQTFDYVYFALLVFGSFLFSMTLIRIVILRNIRALNPLAVFSAIAKTFIPYLFLYVFIGALKFLAFYVNNEYLVGFEYPEIGMVLLQLLMAYVAFVAARLLGLFAKFYEQKVVVARKGEAK